MRYARGVMIPVVTSTLFFSSFGLIAASNHFEDARKVDEYADSHSNDAKARLDNYAIALQNEPDATGYIVAYGGTQCPNRAQPQANLARRYLVYTRQLDERRIVTVDGGRRSNASRYAIELWVVPRGASAPTTTPTLGPCRRRR